MSELLSHSESNITQCVGEAAQKSVTDYLQELNMISDEDHLPRFIPATVLIQHYVEFRLALRRSSLSLPGVLPFLSLYLPPSSLLSVSSF